MQPRHVYVALAACFFFSVPLGAARELVHTTRAQR